MTKTQKPPEPQGMTPAQAAAVLGVSVDTVYRHALALGRKRFGRWVLDPARVHAAAGGSR